MGDVANLGRLLSDTARRLPDRPGLVWRERPWRWALWLIAGQAGWSLLLALSRGGVPTLLPLGLLMPQSLVFWHVEVIRRPRLHVRIAGTMWITYSSASKASAKGTARSKALRAASLKSVGQRIRLICNMCSPPSETLPHDPLQIA